MVPEVLRAEDDLALDVPVDLALEHHPPLVVMMVVGVVGLAGRVADHEGLDVVGQHDRLRPGRRALLGDELGQAALERAQLEQRIAFSHVAEAPRRRASHRRAPSVAWTRPPGKISTIAMKSTPKIKR